MLDKICHKMSIKILPLVVLMFALAMLDRMNISFVKEHLQTDAGISASAYALGAGVFFVGYALFEVPSNLLLHKFGAKLWLSRIMISWGLVTMAMIFIQDELSFYILRFLLGLVEAGFSPGIILYLSYFFPPSHRSKAYGIYQMGVPIAFIFGSIVSGFILDFAPNIYFKSWQWMFIIEGGFTVLVGIFAFFYLDSKPKDIKYLSEDEKVLLLSKLEKAEEKARDHSVLATLFDPLVWKFVFVYFCIQLSVYGVLFYLPTKIALFLGVKVGFKVGLITALPWILVFFALPLITKKADLKMAHTNYAIALLSMATISMVLAAISPNLIIFLIFISLSAIGFIVIQPIFWNLPTQLLKGKSAAAGIALIGSLGNLGGFVAPNLKNYIENLSKLSYSGLILLAFIALLGVFMLIHLKGKIK